MCCIVIEAGERPLGVLPNAVLTPEYSCTDVPLIEDSEPLLYVSERCRSCVCFPSVCVGIEKVEGDERKGIRGSMDTSHPCSKCSTCIHTGAQHLAVHRLQLTRPVCENDLSV